MHFLLSIFPLVFLCHDQHSSTNIEVCFVLQKKPVLNDSLVSIDNSNTTITKVEESDSDLRLNTAKSPKAYKHQRRRSQDEASCAGDTHPDAVVEAEQRLEETLARSLRHSSSGVDDKYTPLTSGTRSSLDKQLLRKSLDLEMDPEEGLFSSDDGEALSKKRRRLKNKTRDKISGGESGNETVSRIESEREKATDNLRDKMPKAMETTGGQKEPEVDVLEKSPEERRTYEKLRNRDKTSHVLLTNLNVKPVVPVEVTDLDCLEAEYSPAVTRITRQQAARRKQRAFQDPNKKAGTQIRTPKKRVVAERTRHGKSVVYNFPPASSQDEETESEIEAPKRKTAKISSRAGKENVDTKVLTKSSRQTENSSRMKSKHGSSESDARGRENAAQFVAVKRVTRSMSRVKQLEEIIEITDTEKEPEVTSQKVKTTSGKPVVKKTLSDSKKKARIQVAESDSNESEATNPKRARKKPVSKSCAESDNAEPTSNKPQKPNGVVRENSDSDSLTRREAPKSTTARRNYVESDNTETDFDTKVLKNTSCKEQMDDRKNPTDSEFTDTGVEAKKALKTRKGKTENKAAKTRETKGSRGKVAEPTMAQMLKPRGARDGKKKTKPEDNQSDDENAEPAWTDAERSALRK